MRRLNRWRALAVAAAAITVGALVSAPTATAAAPPPTDSAGDVIRTIPAPASVWTPPATVNRTVSGAQPPTADWRPGWTPASAAARVAAAACGPAQTGILPQYPLERFPVSDRMEALVNTSDGNLTITQRQLTLKGTGQNLSVSQVYNNQRSGAGAFGSGWTLNSGQDVGLTFTGTDVVLHGDSGYCTTFTRNANGTYSGGAGTHATLTKNADGTFTLAFDQSGEKWAFSAAGWLLSQTDRNSNANTEHYNPDGTLASVTDSQNRVTTFSYLYGRISTITDPTSTVVASYTYNTAGQLTTFTDRDGTPMILTWDSAGNLATITDPNGKVYQFGYDTNRRVTSVTVPRKAGPAITTFAYGAGQTTQTDPNNHAVTYHYDAQGRQTSAVDALGHEQKKTWTANSDVQTTADGLNNSTTASYDALNNLIGTELPTGAANVVGYTDAAHPHLPTTTSDPAGNQIARTYDTAGNLTKIRSVGLGADLQTLTYNPTKGTVASSKDGNNHVTSYGYDTSGNLTSLTPPAPLGATTYTYDSLSRVATVTDGNGVRLNYGYDKLDRVVSVTKHSNNTVLQAMTYDRAGNLTVLTTTHETHTYVYDTSGLVTSDTRDGGAGVQLVSYTYDPARNLKTLTDLGGTTTYGYDNANRLTSLADPFGQTTTFGYDNADRRTSVTWPGAGTQTNGYDNSGRQTSLTVKNTAGTTRLAVTYSYTTTGGADSDQMQSKTDSTGTTAYTYDSLQRLTAAGASTFTHDNASNLTNLAGAAFTINAADQLTQDGARTRGYDGAGNHTTSTTTAETNTYNSTNQFISSTSADGSSYTGSYDTLDQTQPRQFSVTTGGATPTTTVDSFVNTALGITQDTINGLPANFTRDPKGALITEKARNGSRYNFITDYQGSVLGLISTAGNLAATYTYTPYGSVAATGSAAGVNPFHYLGAYQASGTAGNHLLGYRWYNSNWGRFTSTDPTRQEANNYAYGKGDPINNSDPTGAVSLGGALGAIGGAVGGLVGGGLGAFALSAGVLATGGALALGIGVSAALGFVESGIGTGLGGGTSQEVLDNSLLGLSGGIGGLGIILN